ncbi:MAG: zinc-binding dehydrogenase, partial [Melioribacteraceae bacterium]|nr:zinc-binding dehydrogenase [Melioribacteraceae bacterium]
EHTCRNGLFMGCPDQLAGALAEYIVIDENSCFPIDEAATFEEAVLSEPLSIAVYSVERSNFFPNANVAILGAGPIGMSIFHVLRAKKAGDVFITDKIQKRLDFSKQLNPKYAGNPDKEDVVKQISASEPLLMDVVFECTGNPEVYEDAIKLLKPGGNFVIVGIPEVDNITLPIHELRRKEIDVVNIRRQVNCTQKAIDLMHNKNVNMNSMATHHFKLEETDKAYDLVSNYRDGVMKAMITID